MPLHLLGKKSWNVYNADNIARVKADEAAAAAREAAEDERMQEIDAARRAAILRGQTPPPLPDDEKAHEDQARKSDRKDGHDRKRRKLAGEDDTDRDIRLAAGIKGGAGDSESSDGRLVKLRKPTNDAPLTDHAGNINLFPVDLKEQMKREKNEEAEKEKRKKERALEDQYTMRFSNAAGRGGLEQQPWYTSGGRKTANDAPPGDQAVIFPGLENKNVWGNEDPLRRDREQSRIASNDPFAFMQRAQVQLKKSKDDKKKWADEREQELMELRSAQERWSRRERHGKRKHRVDDDEHRGSLDRDAHDKGRSSSHRHRHRSRSRSRERRHQPSASHRHSERRRSSSRSRQSRPRQR
ncbi:hypothetical protein BU23DRAFT_576447 [Bimuria novae-zelandiae CBS 107.79]|uniref:CBF1-interacting co-repressor CIR N-terminal domain-containing protein n=1 Tax=Bimuria novae-zelandiae CBS 107.79 TaxID=1447943 RepID=A0A6A5VR83_9PLEO|nr:hypothetical protein BU23DRAFT_576447 [Bimuria novae-zelandiae CBS 107.79]